MAKKDGLFPKPPEPKCPPHKNVQRNEHQSVCRDCGATWDNPH